MSRRRWFQVLIATIVTAFLLAFSGIASAQGNSGNVVPGSFICQVDSGEDAFAIGQAAARAMGGTLGHVYTYALNGFSIQVPPGIVVANLRAQRGIINAEPDLVVHTCSTIPTGVDRIDAEGVLSASPSINCSSVGIAIIDTGIQRDHPDLNVAGGHHFYTRGFRASDDDQYDDDNGHGTHVAGIAAAKGVGIVGVAPGARLYAVKVLNAQGSGYMSDIVAGVNWVAANAGTLGISVANMSLGGQGKSDALHTALAGCGSVKFAVAAGNSAADIYGSDHTYNTNDDFIPAAYGGDLSNVNTISALVDTDGKPGSTGSGSSYGRDDSFASFSNYSQADHIALIMPGVNIYSTYLNSGYTTMSGTSMASPHAAGLFALDAAGGNITSFAQSSANGLIQPSGDPDGQYEPLGYATYPGSGTEPPPAGGTLHVGDLDGKAKLTGKKWQATVTITVHDGQHNGVSGAVVTGTWSNNVTSTATTGSTGTCTISLGNISTTTNSVTFDVTAVSATGYTYASASNHDPDGDSNGTTITVNKP